MRTTNILLGFIALFLVFIIFQLNDVSSTLQKLEPNVEYIPTAAGRITAVINQLKEVKQSVQQLDK